MINISKKKAYFILVAPPILIYLSAVLFPIAMSFVLGFTSWKGYDAIEFIGFANYIKMFQDPVFMHSLRNNMWIMVSSVLVQIPLGLLLAYMLYRKMVKGDKFFEVMIFLPITISAVVIALLWYRIFSPVGVFTALIRSITGNKEYVVSIFESKYWGIMPVLFVLVWQFTSLYMVIFLANLQRIPQNIIEAAVLDGASEMDIFLRIIIPAMIGVIFINSVFAISGSFKSFDLVFSMTGGGPANYTSVIGIYMYQNTFVYQNYGYGSAVSIVIVLLSVSIIVASKYVMKRVEKKIDG